MADIENDAAMNLPVDDNDNADDVGVEADIINDGVGDINADENAVGEAGEVPSVPAEEDGHEILPIPAPTTSADAAPPPAEEAGSAQTQGRLGIDVATHSSEREAELIRQLTAERERRHQLERSIGTNLRGPRTDNAHFHTRGGTRVPAIPREIDAGSSDSQGRRSQGGSNPAQDYPAELARIEQLLERLVRSNNEGQPTTRSSYDIANAHFNRRTTLGERDPRGGPRQSLYGHFAAATRTGTRAKLKHPPVFGDERYDELNNVLNWIITVERYLYNCDVVRELYPSYAYTYFSKTVQAWYDNRFLTVPIPDWEDVTVALKQRYLPTDHVPRLLRRFTQVRQIRSLLEYVDTFQVMVSAIEIAGITKSQEELIRQFIDGLKNFEDRVHMLTNRATNVEQCYEMAVLIRGAKAVASGTDTDRRKLNRLTGQAKKDAFKNNGCLECGSKDHWWRDCPKLSNKTKNKYMDKKGNKNAGRSKVRPKKNFAMAAGAKSPTSSDTEEEDEDEEEKATDSESSSDTGNDSEESAGGADSTD